MSRRDGVASRGRAQAWPDDPSGWVSVRFLGWKLGAKGEGGCSFTLSSSLVLSLPRPRHPIEFHIETIRDSSKFWVDAISFLTTQFDAQHFPRELAERRGRKSSSVWMWGIRRMPELRDSTPPPLGRL